MMDCSGKKIIMCIAGMRGGGAERIACVLMNELKRSGAEPSVFITSQPLNDADRSRLDKDIRIIGFDGESDGNGGFKRFGYKLLRIFSSIICKIFEKSNKEVPSTFAYFSFVSQYYGQIGKLRNILKANPDAVLIAFLQPSIPISLLAARGLDNRVIFSERGDPERLMKKRFGRKFIEKYYLRTDAAVFQTEDAKKAYPEEIAKKSVVIFNPVTPGLPQPYDGERRKVITTFCRISKQKNLPVLIDAFNKVHKNHPDFKLRIIGSAQNADDRAVLANIKEKISSYSLDDSVMLEPFSNKVHSLIIKDYMYVNSSDYEGMSNAMLEAMAIGLPCVCTDCPIGGANAIIKDGINGLLVPVGDADALAAAIEKVISQPELVSVLSHNARRIREDLKLENIAKQWMELV